MLVTFHRPLPYFRLIGLVLTAALITFGACDNSDSQKSVTGQVIAVEARSITEFETLTLRDEDGVTWEFTGGLFTGFTPSHLLEHKALGDPVRVWYDEIGGELRVKKIEDG